MTATLAVLKLFLSWLPLGDTTPMTSYQTTSLLKSIKRPFMSLPTTDHVECESDFPESAGSSDSVQVRFAVRFAVGVHR